MKVLISGSRDYRKLDYVSSFLSILSPTDHVVVGDARGVDKTAINYLSAGKMGITVPNYTIYFAGWDIHGKKAGIVRNLEMLDTVPDLVMAFWNGQSTGTKFVIDAALKRCLNLRVQFDLL